MKTKITTKDIILENSASKHLSRYLQKIEEQFPNTESDLMEFTFFVRKNIDKYLPKQKYIYSKKDYIKGKLALAQYEGYLLLTLPVKVLITRFKSRTVDEGLHLGFKNLIKEIRKYKQMHYRSDSQYPSHLSIRG